MTYTLRDISVIIPTYNRVDDLRITLDSFRQQIAQLNEVIIVDQSPTPSTKQLIRGLKNKKIIYVRSEVPALTIARNKGIDATSPRSKIIVFLDDDVSLSKHYFEEIIRVFNEHPSARGVGGYYLPRGQTSSWGDAALRRLFFVEHRARNCATVLSAYGAVYPSALDKIIRAQWIPGFNMAFKKEIFQKMKFDEHLLRYSLAEDFDFTYRVHTSWPKSLYLTPYAKLVHRASVVERYPVKKISYMNQAHHFYLNYKNFNRNMKEKIIFWWAVFGISFLRMIQFSLKPNQKNALKLTFYFSSLVHCLANLRAIRKGKFSIPE